MTKHILIIDDEEILRTSLMQYLDDCGYNVKIAADGYIALDILDKNQDIELAVVDLRMPGMSGDKFIIQANKKFPGLKFIIQTGNMDYRPAEDLTAIGITPEVILHKPVLKLTTYVELIERLISD